MTPARPVHPGESGSPSRSRILWLTVILLLTFILTATALACRPWGRPRDVPRAVESLPAPSAAQLRTSVAAALLYPVPESSPWA